MILWGSSMVQNTFKGERCQAYVEACVILMLKLGKITQEKKIMVSFSYEHAHEDPK